MKKINHGKKTKFHFLFICFLLMITFVSIFNQYQKEISWEFLFQICVIFILDSFLIYSYIVIQKKDQKIYEIAYIDSITGLGNEEYFKKNALKFIQDDHHKYIAVFDINQFNNYIKLYGHEFCNQLLKKLGQKLKNVFPFVSRASRDVFLIVFESNCVDEFIPQILEKLSTLIVDGMSLHLSFSVGIYPIKRGETNIDKILDKAYMAHTNVKRNCNEFYYIFDDTLENKLLEEQQIEISMEKALENHDFKVVYQPKVNVSDERLSGAEALVRWCIQGKNISPSQFIPIFERNKFILKLDLYVFEQVCKDMHNWKEQYDFEIPISINISKIHFIEEDFIEEYMKILNRYQIDPQKIEFEITETATIDSEVDIYQILDNIRKKGFLISIDDFGTGYSSLSMLQNMPIDVLKIDKLFVDNANLNSNENLINYINFMAQRLGIKTIVEGVETKEQVDFIKQLKCDKIQGYYYSKPLEKKEFEEYFRNIQK